MHNTLLVIHILAAATWFGGSMSVTFLTSRMRKRGHETGISFMMGYEKMGRLYFPPAAIIVLATGIWLVLDSTTWDFEDTFVIIGIAAVIVGAVLGSAFFDPAAKAIRAAHESGSEHEIKAGYRRFGRYALIDLAILVVAFSAMVNRLGG